MNVTKKQRLATSEKVQDLCVKTEGDGANNCTVAKVTTGLFGTNNASDTSNHTLSVVATCYPLAMAQAYWAALNFDNLKSIHCKVGMCNRV